MSSDVEVLAEALHKTLLGCTNDCFDHEGRRTHGSWGTDAAEGVLAAMPEGWHLTTEATDTERLREALRAYFQGGPPKFYPSIRPEQEHLYDEGWDRARRDVLALLDKGSDD